MAQQSPTLRDLLAREADDESFRDRLAADPLGVRHAEGVRVDSNFLKERLGVQQSARVLRETIDQVETRVGKVRIAAAPAKGNAAPTNDRVIPRAAWQAR